MSIAFISTIPIWLLIFTASPFHNEVSILICSFTSWIEPRAVISILQLPFRLLLLFSSPFLRQSLFDGEVTIFFRCKDIMQRCRSIYGSLRSDQWHTRKSSDIFLLREKIGECIISWLSVFYALNGRKVTMWILFRYEKVII